MEQVTRSITIAISQAAEIIAALVIATAIVRIVISYCSGLLRNTVHSNEVLRVRFGSDVAVALELLLGADVLATAIAPSWNDIGQLAAIATIRTLLNYFLAKELKHLK